MESFGLYAEVKKEFELSHFKLITPFCYCHEDNDEVIIRSKDEMKSLYENLYYTDVTTTIDKKRCYKDSTNHQKLYSHLDGRC